MKTKLAQYLLSALLSVAFTLTLHAQTSAFTYQGRLTDTSGPANGTYDLQFTIYDAATGGSVVAGPITNSSVVVTNGLFTTTLDFGAGVFDGSDRWLAIGVATNGSGVFAILSPRQLITSTPYAIQAANAANAAVAASASSVSAANVTGTLTTAQLPTSVVTNGAGGVTFSGTFSGDGLGITNANLNLLSGGAISWGNFKLASSPAVGNEPVSVTAADVNGDGKMDLIDANYAVATLTVLTNNGSGGFATAATLGVGNEPDSVTTADVNGDGHPDLISANYLAHTLTVLTNDGSGGFVLASSPAVGGSPKSVTAADVNGDGHPDLICANATDNTLTVLTNNGSGGFAIASSPAVGNDPSSVTAADVNGDGKVDLISANYGAYTLTVLTNNGSGGFVRASTLALGNYSVFVTAADVNGDGKVDLISANPGANTLTVLTNDGSGGFVTASLLGVGISPESVTSADVNGDGHPDLISANQGDNTLTVLTNNGSGSFVRSSTLAVGNTPVFVTAAEVNGDGKVDLISADYGGSYGVYTLTVLFNGVVIKGNFTGDGSGLTDLNAANLTGSVPAASLTSVPAANLTGSVPAASLTSIPAASLTGSVPAVSLTSVPAASLIGSVPAASLTSVPATNLTGTVPDARLSANVALRSGGNAYTGTQTVTGGKVGIGTTTPSAALQVAGSGFFGADSGLLSPSVGSGVRIFYDSLVQVGQLYAYNYSNSTPQNLVLQGAGGNVGIGTTTPQSKLQVNGNIQLGSGGTNYAVSSQENLRIVRGVVDPTGHISVGTGFTVVSNSVGDWTINFTPAFPSSPAVTVTAFNDDLASLSSFGPSYVELHVLHSGTRENMWFSFIAIGQQ